MNQDFLDLLDALIEAETRFMVVGAYAMSVHGVPRATGDLDIWLLPDPENAARAWKALLEFGAPLDGMDVRQTDLEAAETVIQIGLPPRRIDILTSLTGLEFESCWPNRVIHRMGTLDVPFLGRDDLVRNKRALGRPKDLADLAILENPTEE